VDDRTRIDKLPQPIPFPELADLVRERARLREEALALSGGLTRIPHLERAAASARAEAARRGEDLADDAPELVALAKGREETAAASLRHAALLDAIVSVETEACALIERKRAAYLDGLGKQRGPAEERVGKALADGEAALVELATGQALYAYLDDFPDVSYQQGAYSADGVELPLRGVDGRPLSVGALLSALREAAGRPRRRRRARLTESLSRPLAAERRSPAI
jgi:hypothetical protein